MTAFWTFGIDYWTGAGMPLTGRGAGISMSAVEPPAVKATGYKEENRSHVPHSPLLTPGGDVPQGPTVEEHLMGGGGGLTRRGAGPRFLPSLRVIIPEGSLTHPPPTGARSAKGAHGCGHKPERGLNPPPHCLSHPLVLGPGPGAEAVLNSQGNPENHSAAKSNKAPGLSTQGLRQNHTP